MIFLDFDGVLFDSVREAYVMARYAYSGVEVTEPINEEHYHYFSKIRYMIVHAWHYRIQMEMLDQLSHGDFNVIDLERRYKTYTAQGKQSSDFEFEQRYFDRRAKMIKEDYGRWMNLSEPYPFFWGLCPLFEHSKLISIVTSKNRDAVLRSMAWHGIIVSPELILDVNDIVASGHKGTLIRSTMLKEGVSEAYFVDDSSSNLLDCEGIEGLHCLLAGWGYCSPWEKGCSMVEALDLISKFTGITHE